MSDEFGMVPPWLMERVSKPSGVFVFSSKTPVRLHQFSKSPRLRHMNKKHFSNEPESNLKNMRKQFYSNVGKFEKKQKKLMIQNKQNKGSLLVNFVENFKETEIINHSYKPRIRNLPPIKNKLARSVAYNSLISSVGIKYNSSDEDNAEWHNSESDEDAKNIQDYLIKYSYLH